jgi:hypothetical protein
MKFAFNPYAVRAIYGYEMGRTRRTLLQSIVSPVISASARSKASAMAPSSCRG